MTRQYLTNICKCTVIMASFQQKNIIVLALATLIIRILSIIYGVKISSTIP